MLTRIFTILLFVTNFAMADFLLIPMDLNQTDHLKAYGIAYWILGKETNVEWLLNYRGGSFLIPQFSIFESECLLRGVYYETISSAQVNDVYATIADNNMDKILLEKAPKIAVSSMRNAVTLRLPR